MNNFLRNSINHVAELSSLNFLKIVLGNESCDLDSAISSLVYAFYLNSKTNIPVIPVLNINKNELPLKTEVTYFLRKNNVCLENIIFRDSFDIDKLLNKSLELILVDHHVLSSFWSAFAPAVTTILDHRPKDINWNWNDSVSSTIELVGSCATLIGREILEDNDMAENEKCLLMQSSAQLLYGTIILDSINFSVSAARAKPLDFEVTEQLERVLKISKSDTKKCRLQLFNELVKARTDISSLTPLQLLSKDLKFANNVPVAGLPMLVENYLKLDDSYDAVVKFSKQHETTLAVLMGIEIKGDEVTRDMALYHDNNENIANKLRDSLMNFNNSEFLLEIKDCNLSGVILFKQRNNKASRKHIFPVIKDTVDCFCNADNR